MIEYLIQWQSLIVVGFLLFLSHYLIPIKNIQTLLFFSGVLVIAFGLFQLGKSTEREHWKDKMHTAELAISDLKAKQGKVNTVIVTEYKDKIIYIDKVSVQTVTEFVTKYDDQKCTINEGFVVFHDSHAANSRAEISGTESNPSEIKLSDVADTLKVNYAIHFKTAAQLESLQKWITQQKILWDQKK